MTHTMTKTLAKSPIAVRDTTPKDICYSRVDSWHIVLKPNFYSLRVWGEMFKGGVAVTCGRASDWVISTPISTRAIFKGVTQSKIIIDDRHFVVTTNSSWGRWQLNSDNYIMSIVFVLYVFSLSGARWINWNILEYLIFSSLEHLMVLPCTPWIH